MKKKNSAYWVKIWKIHLIIAWMNFHKKINLVSQVIKVFYILWEQSARFLEPWLCFKSLRASSAILQSIWTSYLTKRLIQTLKCLQFFAKLTFLLQTRLNKTLLKRRRAENLHASASMIVFLRSEDCSIATLTVRWFTYKWIVLATTLESRLPCLLRLITC